MMTIKDLDFIRRVSSCGGKFRSSHHFTNLRLAITLYKIKQGYAANRRLHQRNNKSK